ncbi:hypothetical protein AB1Y20_021434 [Prymnesium parvum]|uniref:Phospholipid-transporting ATPase n=1 Tax=Prymnesium parvum TaxID=97485 RepID=A0AB34JIN3_PRYPA
MVVPAAPHDSTPAGAPSGASRRSPWVSAPELDQLDDFLGTRQHILAALHLQRVGRGLLARKRKALLVAHARGAPPEPHSVGPQREIGTSAPAPSPWASAPELADLAGVVIGTREQVLACIRIQASARGWRQRRRLRPYAPAPAVSPIVTARTQSLLDMIPLAAEPEALPRCRDSDSSERRPSTSSTRNEDSYSRRSDGRAPGVRTSAAETKGLAAEWLNRTAAEIQAAAQENAPTLTRRVSNRMVTAIELDGEEDNAGESSAASLDKREEQEVALPRRLDILAPNTSFCSNCAKTSRFTALNFLPLALAEQLHPFHKFVNCYFLLAGALQLLSSITLTEGMPMIWLNVGVLFVQDMITMALEDAAKHRADASVNSQHVEVLHAGSDDFEHKLWADVCVGDVVRVRDRQAFPADLLLLRACDPDPGQCWVNTKPIDGETDTKLRLAPRISTELLKNDDAATLRNTLRGHVLTETPNDKVNDFSGQLCLEGHAPVLLARQNVCLRGCQLRSTDWVLGLVVFTGVDTKSNYSAGKAPKPKRAHTLRMLNRDLLFILLVLLLVCTTGATVNHIFTANRREVGRGVGGAGVVGYGMSEEGIRSWWFLQDDAVASVSEWFRHFGIYFLLEYMYMPTTLFVTMPLIQIFTCLFMVWDLSMYDEEQDEPCSVNTPTLSEELGQVSHIFSDKTGTLTSNHMEFRRCVIDGVAYGCGDTAISRSLRKNMQTQKLRQTTLPDFAGCKPASAKYVGFVESEGSTSIFSAMEGPQKEKVQEFFLALAINHSVMLEEVGGKLQLCASSPDEQAFVAAAEYFGFEYLGRDAFAGQLTLLEKRTRSEHVIEILDVFPYESSRKRMSVLVRLPKALVDTCGGGCATRLYVKGADSVMLTLLAPESARNKAAGGAQLGASAVDIDDLLEEWGEIALRTLVWCKRELPRTLYDEWSRKYDAATSSPRQVQLMKAGKSNKISALQEELESMLELQGATAIEDKLQDGVPELLMDLRTAGIKIWMLTGDKVGTAINIARACNILTVNAEVYEITSENFPVLADVPALEMLAIQNKIQSAAKADQMSLILEQSDLLDAKYPGLLEVRQALLKIATLLGALPGTSDVRGSQFEVNESDSKAWKTRSVSTVGMSTEQDVSLVLDEKAIEYCSTICRDAVAAVGNACRSVVACRARKDQKAQMLSMIRESTPGCCCLAIGDGANDVAMIKAGHIGVGIVGKEGKEAVNAADFAIGQFRFLRSLLLLHGRHNYRRFAIFLYFTFYKNIVTVMAMFYWSCFALASGTLLFPSIFTDLLNPVMVTSLPILLYPMFDTDVSKEESLSTPKLYSAGLTRLYYTRPRLLTWVFEGIFAAAICSFLPTFLEDGDYGTASVSEVSLASMWTVCIVIDARLVLENHSWTALDIFGVFAMVVVLIIWTVFFSFLLNDEPGSFGWGFLYGTVPQLFVRPTFWLVLLLAVLLALAPRSLVLGYQCVFRGAGWRHLTRAARNRLNASSRVVVNALTAVRLPGVAKVADCDTQMVRRRTSRRAALEHRSSGDIQSPSLWTAATFSVDPASANYILKHGRDKKYRSQWSKVRAVSHIISEFRLGSNRDSDMRI